MSPHTPPEPPIATTVRRSWHRFIEESEPLRAELYRYCRYLTRAPWDAEDLVQDTLARAFVALASQSEEPRSPKAWLFRIASNLWLNRVKRRTEQLGDVPDVGVAPPDAQGAREAAGSLLATLAPQERAAVVLKDVFDLSLDEIAGALSTTPGAVKAALHRGRGKLQEPDTAREKVAPMPAVLDAFCAAFNARDLDRVTALLLENFTMEHPGLSLEHGADAARRGSFTGLLSGRAVECSIEPGQRAGVHVSAPRLELRAHRDAHVLLLWWQHDDGEAVRSIALVDVDGERIAHMKNYFHAPEVIAEVCRELAVPFRTNGYRHWWTT